ncbi:unnamed protein product [Aphanomyces euteiches]|nr:hypothetical protein AeRB84_019207 [Aphanomyces euteiches]
MADEIAVVDGEFLSYEEFCAEFMAKNVPVLIKNIGKDWSVFQRWIQSDGRLDRAYLTQMYGQAQVPVVSYDTSNAYGEEDRSTVSLGLAFALNMKIYIIPWTIETYMAGLEETPPPKRYMKDWHFTRDFPNDSIYITPRFFTDDWLNWWWDRKGGDDYRFVYLGPKGSFTPLHHDVLQSYSWSINIAGQKEWILFPPSETWKLKNRFGRTPSGSIKTCDPAEFPHAASAQRLTIVQDIGTALFVPSGWFHQVTNLTETLSINHNWFNAYTLRLIWVFFQQELQAVEHEIAHCRDSFESVAEWREHCQLILRANIGMNYDEFHQLLQSKADELGHGSNANRRHDAAFALDEVVEKGFFQAERKL